MSNKKHILMKKQKLEYSPNINKLRYFVFTPILCMIFSFTFAQQAINGIVLDENSQPIPGVSILEKGTNNGVETDFDGNYSMDVSSMNSILVFSSIGFSSQEVAVENQTIISVSLQEDVSLLEEVVVTTGYGTKKRRDITGSIASINAGQIDSRPIASVEEALQGMVPGLNIAQRASSPGELGTISIRGLGSITAGTQPLWVIDGFPTDQRTHNQSIPQI